MVDKNLLLLTPLLVWEPDARVTGGAAGHAGWARPPVPGSLDGPRKENANV